MSQSPPTNGQAEPGAALRLVRGDALPEELAALVAVLSARAGASAAAGPAPGSGRPPRGRWGDPRARVRPAHRPGPGAWRASGLPS
ncbi:MAG: acyl-CoA carboxylase subunit epsilon [Actinomycetales bacterium]